MGGQHSNTAKILLLKSIFLIKHSPMETKRIPDSPPFILHNFCGCKKQNKKINKKKKPQTKNKVAKTVGILEG